MIKQCFDLYRKYGESDYIGEDVSQNEHMIQSAMLAEQHGEPIHIILACFFHDIGHLIQEYHQKMNHLGVKHHEKIGAQLLRNSGIPEPIPTLVEHHVKTKQYKVFKFKNYHNTLSNASKNTLILQGGQMTPEQAFEFEQHPLFLSFMKIRHYDDHAKVIGLNINPLSYYEDMCSHFMSKL